MVSSAIIGGSLALSEGLIKAASLWLTGQTIEQRFKDEYEIRKSAAMQKLEVKKKEQDKVLPRASWTPDRDLEEPDALAKTFRTFLWKIREMFSS